MGDVIELRPRTGQRKPPADKPAPTPPAEPAQTSDVAKTPVPELRRPEWLGVRRPHRQALRTHMSHIARRTGRRVLFEVFQGVPRRGFRVLRWFVRGVVGHRDTNGDWVGGWVGLMAWCFAARERADAKAAAAENPGVQVRATEHADQIAIWHSAFLIAPHIIGAFAINHYTPAPWWLVFAPLVIGTIIYGHHTDPKPPDHIDAPRIRGDITRDALEEALRAVRTLAKPTNANPQPDTIQFARPPRMVGDGQEVVVDLPASVQDSAADVVRKREKIAASLAVPLAQLHIEPGDHAGRVVIWYAVRDPFAGEPAEHPLLDAPAWSVFDGAPVGTDARRRPVTVPLIDTNFLIGGLPGSGKTSWARSIASAVVLDPLAELYVFDGKQGKDWAALEPVSEVFEAGRIPEQAARLAELLQWFLSDGDDRFHKLRQYPDDVCPDSRITRALAEDGLRFRFLILDEAHRYLADPKHGETITRLLIDYVKGYRACGFGLMFITQDTGSDLSDRFTSLRRVIGTRIACRVMGFLDSNMILGDQMNTRGWDASEILPNQVGTGILRADLEVDSGQSHLARMVRSYYMDQATWHELCNLGADLRRQATPSAAHDGEPGVLAMVTGILAEHGELSASGLLEHLPEPWSSLGPNRLGLELRSLGVRSVRTQQGRRYQHEHVSRVLSMTRRDPVLPRRVVNESDADRDKQMSGVGTGGDE